METSYQRSTSADTSTYRTAPRVAERLFVTFLATYSVLLLAVGYRQLGYPFFHFDDVPALVLLPQEYFSKAATEGRWFNYLWHLRDVYTPPWLNFQFYLVGWAFFLAAAAVNIFRTGPLYYPVLMAILIALGPQTTLIAGWYNTLIPGVWLLAAFSVASLFTSERTGRWLMALAVPISLQAYTPYPFLILAICLLREDRSRTLNNLRQVLTLFGLAFIVGVLLIFALNYAIIGVFGVEPAGWRSPSLPSGFGDMAANLGLVADSLAATFVLTGSGSLALSTTLLLMFLAALAVLARSRPNDTLSILLVMLAGLGFLSLFSVAKGLEFPARATSFAWFIFAAALVGASRTLETASRAFRFLSLACIAALCLTQAVYAKSHFTRAAAWLARVSDIAARIPDGTTLIYVYGPRDQASRSPQPGSDLDLIFHLAMLSGIPATDCGITPENCSEIELPIPQAGMPIVTDEVGNAFLFLPIPAGQK